MDDGFSVALNALFTMGNDNLTILLSHLTHVNTRWVTGETKYLIGRANRDASVLNDLFMQHFNYADKRLKYIQLVREITNPGLVSPHNTPTTIDNEPHEELPPRYERVQGIPERPRFSDRSGLNDILRKIEVFNVSKIECLVKILLDQSLLETDANIKGASPDNPYEVIDVLKTDLTMEKINEFALVVENVTYFTPSKENDWVKHLDYTYDMDDTEFNSLILKMTDDNTTWVTSLVRSKLKRQGRDREEFNKTMKNFLYLNERTQQGFIRLVNTIRN